MLCDNPGRPTTFTPDESNTTHADAARTPRRRHHHRPPIAAALALLLASCGGGAGAQNLRPAPPPPPDEVIATVDGRPVRAKVYEMFVRNGREALGIDEGREEGRRVLAELRALTSRARV